MDYPTQAELEADGIDALTIQQVDGEFYVYGWGEYPENTVLEGQTRKVWLAGFPTLDEAREAFPDAYVVN